MDSGKRKRQRKARATPVDRGDGGVPPPVGLADIPDFSRLGEDKFEEMCCELLAEQQGVTSCERFGVRGQRQRGVDLKARLIAGGLLAAQCKCYRAITKTTIRRASEDFLKHWSTYWAARDVKQFTLLVACETGATDIHEEIETQSKRFEAVGIDYEVLGRRSLTNRLKGHRSIVWRFMRAWVDDLCGTTPLPTSTGGGGQTLAVAVVSQAFTAMIDENVAASEELNAIQDVANSGRRREASRQIQALCADRRRWAGLVPKQQARALRLEAILLLMEPDRIHLAQAQGLVSQADALHPPGTRVVRAMIAEVERGPVAALELLTEAVGAEELAMRARLLLMLDRPREALEALVGSPLGVKSDADVHRWRAHAFLALGEVAKARLESAKAVRLEPRHLGVVFAAAVVDYFSALAVPALPRGFAWLPQPVRWEFVKHDSASREYLRSAERGLQNLLATAEEDGDAGLLPCWLLATLANDPTRTQEAEAYCAKLLERDRDNCVAIAWASARGWRVDLRASTKALAKKVATSPEDITEVLTLVGLLLRQKKTAAAQAVLDQQRRLFAGERAIALLRLWQTQVLVHSGRTSDALALTEIGGGAADRGARSLALLAAAERSGDFGEYLRHADSVLAQVGDPTPLFDGCLALASRKGGPSVQDWAALAPRREFLENVVGTADAVRLSAAVSWEVQDFEGCLRTLDRHCGAFQDGHLPMDLRQMRVACQTKLGWLNEARGEAARLAREDPSLTNILTSVQVHLKMGDTHRAALEARPLLNEPELDAVQALALARDLCRADADLARRFWRRVHSAGVPDQLAPAAWALGSRLGIAGHEMQELLAQMQRAALSGRSKAIQALSFEDVVRYHEDWRRRGEELDRKYRQAALPMHALAESQGLQLASLYRASLHLRETASMPQGQILTRWGGRPGLDEFPSELSTLPELVVDTSGLLLGAHFDLLDAVERTFAPVRLPHSLPDALRHMALDIAQQQPERIAALHEVECLIESGLLAVRPGTMAGRWEEISDALAQDMGGSWVEALTQAHSSGGVLAGFTPARRANLHGGPRDLSPEVASYLVSSGDIATALRGLGTLPAEGLSGALRVVDAPTGNVRTHLLAQGTPVFLEAGLAGVLAQAGLLDLACRAFSVALDGDEREHIAAQLRAARAGTELAEWLEGLTRRVAEGLADGRYSLCPEVTDERLGVHGVSGLPMRVLLETLAPQADQASVLWVEDRCISAQAPTWNRNVVGVYEILRILRHRQAIDDKTYYERMLRVRRARIYFIPAEAAELVHWLDQACVGTSVVETEELATIRRYFAAAFDAETFVVPEASDAESPGEAPFVLGLKRAIEAALSDVWRSHRPQATKEGMSEWLWTSFSVHEVRRLPFGAREPRPELFAMRLATLLLRDVGAHDEGVSAEETDPYVDWLERRLFADRLATDEALRVQVARHIRDYLALPPRGGPDAPDGYEAAWRTAMGRWADRLPRSVREEVRRDRDLMKRLGREGVFAVRIGPLPFAHPSVWGDFAKAVDEGRAEALTLEGQAVAIEAVREDMGVWVLMLRADGKVIRLAAPLNGLLASDVHDREAALRRCRDSFDCSDGRFETELAEIATLADPAARIEAAGRWLDRSTAAWREALGAKLQPGASLTKEDLTPPPMESLLGSRRLPMSQRDADLARQLDDAGLTLLNDVGLAESLSRLGSLPVALPTPVVQALEGLAPAERAALLGEHAAACGSPLARIHALWLLLKFADDEGNLAAASAQLTWLATNGLIACRTLIALAEAALDQLQAQQGLLGYGVGQRLAAAWIHATDLDALLRRRGAPEEWILELGRWALRGAPAEWLRLDPELLSDVAWPQQLSPSAFLVFGLAYALSADPVRGGELFEPLRGSIVDRIAPDADGLRVAAPEIRRNLALASNALGSFLSWRPEMVCVLGEDIGPQVTPEFTDGLVRHVVRMLEDSPNASEPWAQLALVQVAFPLPGDLRSILESVLRRIDARQLMSEVENAVPVLDIVLFLSLQKGLGHLSIDDDAAKTLLVNTACRLHETEAANLPARSRLEWVLLEACRAAAIVGGDPEASAKRLAQLLREAVEAWPNLSRRCRDYVQTLVDRLPVAQAKWLWTLHTYLRSLP